MTSQTMLGMEYLDVAHAGRFCFRNAWSVKEAHFRPCFLPVLAALPALLAALILLVQILRLLVPWRARWMRPFVEDYAEPMVETEIVSTRKWTPPLTALVFLASIGFCLEAVAALLGNEYLTVWFSILPWSVILFQLLTFRMRTVPYAVLTILASHIVIQATLLGETLRTSDPTQVLRIVDLTTGVLALAVLLTMPFRDPLLPGKEISRPFSEPTSSLRSPEEIFNLWQFMTVSWVNPLLSTGRKRQLENEDVWSLPYQFQHRKLHETFRELKGTVVQRLLAANAVDISILIVFGLIEQLVTYAGPVLLQAILSTMEDSSVPTRVPMTYAALTLVARLVSCQLGVMLLWFGRRSYERSRGEMITMLYEKTLNRKIMFELPQDKEDESGKGDGLADGHPSKTAEETTWIRFKAFFTGRSAPAAVKEPTSSGKLLNLMRNDVYEVSQRFWEIDSLVRKPISVILSVTLVVNYLGWPALMAAGLMIVAQSVNGILARVNVYVEKRRRKATDSKLQIITQFIEAIRHLRWYGWQGAWLTQILSARHKELMLRLVSSGVNLVIGFTNSLALDLSPVIAFYAYTVIGKKPLTVDIAFPALQLFNMMTSNLKDLPQLIITLINAWVAVGRIEDFMAEPNKAEDSTEALIGDSMTLEHSSFAWPGSSNLVLKDLDISFPQGLTVVCGEVATGKSALLGALLGEMDLRDGRLIKPQEPIGYCAQTPWLQSMSIRENILFSAPFEQQRYQAVLDGCALTPDLAALRAGDLSMIGENGIGLSGGQRARVALARAVYSRTKILLLDDPLSALDQQTAEAIVQNCLTGPLVRGRTVVLVTHRTDLVASLAKQIIKLESGTSVILDRNAAAVDSNNLQKVVSPHFAAPTTEEVEATKAVAVPDRFVDEERRAHGGIEFSVYWQYIKAGTLRLWFLAFLGLAVDRIGGLAGTWFLKAWGEAYRTKSSVSLLSWSDNAIHIDSGLFDDYPPPEDDIHPWLLTFFLLSLAQSFAYLLSQVMMVLIVYTAGKNLFYDIMNTVANATFRFYDTTPVGRLMNRMTSDIGVIDGGIGHLFESLSWCLINWLASIIIIASITPSFLVFTVILTVAFILIFRQFLPASQSLRRLEMVSLTPLISNFGDLINGLTTVRAFHAQTRFQDRVIEVVDTFQKMDHFYWSTQAWIQWRYDLLSAFANFFLFVLALATGLSPGLTAFALISANRFVMATHTLCRIYGQLQMDFVSVERVIELLHLEQEPKGDVTPPAWWPSCSGDIVFSDVTIKYAPHLDPALSGVSFTVKGGSKTAVLGRTGSGKSTLALAMLATIVPDIGQILIDNVDLAKVEKQLLRTRITFLAQDPVLFPGTMRQNLDPINEYSDQDCMGVLHRVCEKQGWTLDTHIEAGGKNVSQGQRQLVGLARAVLRRSAVIILDEATASIDRETAMQIQQVMHEEMKESTVITIAHRLEAVKNADYCIVLGKGEILKQGPAEEMLKDQQSRLPDNVDDLE